MFPSYLCSSECSEMRSSTLFPAASGLFLLQLTLSDILSVSFFFCIVEDSSSINTANKAFNLVQGVKELLVDLLVLAFFCLVLVVVVVYHPNEQE